MVDTSWSILGIESTADKKQIKRAYSKKLKVTKPDQDPDGFMRLRAAYEDALYQADYIEHDLRDNNYQRNEAPSPISSEPSPVTPTENEEDAQINNDNFVDPLKVQPAHLNQDLLRPDYQTDLVEDDKAPDNKVEQDAFAEQNTSLSQDQADLDAIENNDKAVEDLLDKVKGWVNKPASSQTLQEWDELFNSEFILDLHYRRYISKSVFDILLDKYHTQYKAKGHFTVLPNAVLNALDNTFDWSNDEDLQQYYSDEDYFKIAKKPARIDIAYDKEASFIKRGLATLIDFTLIAVVSVFLTSAFVINLPFIDSYQNSDKIAFLLGFVFCFTFYFLWFECGDKAASLGKRLLKLYVATETGLMPAKWRLYLRVGLKMIFMLVVSFVQYAENIPSAISILIFWVSVSVYNESNGLFVFKRNTA